MALVFSGSGWKWWCKPAEGDGAEKMLPVLSAPGLAGVSYTTSMVFWSGSGPACLKCNEMAAFVGKEKSGVGVKQRGIKQGEQGWGERVFSQLHSPLHGEVRCC